MAVNIAVGTIAAHHLFNNDVQAYIELAKLADKAEIDQIVFTDHVIMGNNLDAYPFGDFPLPIDFPWYEPLTLLSAIASTTKTIRLATGVLISPLRPASLLAKQLATLDQISNGRVDLGVGTGWQKEEYEAQNLDFSLRFQYMDDQLTVLNKLLYQAPVTVNNSVASINELSSYPHAKQQQIPIWFGLAPTALNAQRIAQSGKGWIPIKTNAEFIEKGSKLINKSFNEVGRLDTPFIRTHARLKEENGKNNLQYSLDYSQKQVKAGATHIEFEVTSFCQSAEEIPAFFEQIKQIQ